MSGFIKTFNTALGPKAIGPYSTAKIFNGVMYLSGQIGIDPQTGELVSDDVEKQATMALNNLKTIVEETKCSLDNVLRCTVYLTVIMDERRTWMILRRLTQFILNFSRKILRAVLLLLWLNFPKELNSR